MPPSKHSSSSHHNSSSSRSSFSSSRPSSSRSSSHSSSSRSSFSSSRSSSSHSSFGGSSSRPSSGYRSSNNPKPYRSTRRSNPGINYGLLWFLTRNRNNSSYSSGSSSSYSSGSSGSSYQNSATGQKPVDTSVTCSCQYCGSSFHFASPEEVPAVCPNCGGSLDILTSRKAAQEPSQAAQPTASRTFSQPPKSSFRFFRNILLLAVVLIALNRMGVFSFRSDSNTAVQSTQDSSSSPYYSLNNDELYVKEIDRTCFWDEETETYYDSDTDCYFILNDYVEPPVWQYWYEGISSDFGDYGWMEYDTAERCWYIERSDNDWIKLPSKYDTSYLWYIKENRMP